MKTYNISQLKANISEAIRFVKKGNKVCILDRETPVATLIPVLKNEDNLKIRHPLRKRTIATIYTDITIKNDIQKILQEDRSKR
jgi:antitoxin (DNA-binding transcriptional repressor) of toxin-antitoxin stability system